jgi:hypothetical protein
MAFEPLDARLQKRQPLLRVADPHLGRLANDRQTRARAALGQGPDQRRDPEAADLLVKAEGEVKGHAKRALERLRHQRQHQRDEAFHVGRAAPVEAVGAPGQAKRVAVPVLPRDRHDIGVAGQDDAAALGRADRREQIGLFPSGVVGQGAADAVAVEIVGDPVDQRQVRVGRNRVETDEAFENAGRGSVHRLTRCRACLRPACRSSPAPRGGSTGRCGRRRACGSSPS